MDVKKEKLQLNEREQVVGIGQYRLQGRETNYTTLYIYIHIETL